MGVDVIYLLRLYTGVSQGILKGQGCAFPVRIGLYYVNRVPAGSITYQFSINMGAALFSMLHLLQDNDPRAFPHYKTAPLCIKRTAGLVRLIISGR